MAATKSIAAPPEVIAGRYRIEQKLGQGGMGSVWRAHHLTLRSPVAIKLIDPSLAESEDAVARFLREAQAAASLRSPHVVQILDHGVDQGVPYIAMELLEGESLADRLQRMRKLSPSETARVMTHVARAMGRAHEAGIVHRDLKPDNVFLVRNDDEEIAKVLDFGIAKATAKAFDITTGTRTGAMLGTPYYMSPEQVEGVKTIDHRSDLWAMGVIAFECLTGVRPFESDTLGALLLQICSKPIMVPSQQAQVPPGFDEWFARATQRAPAERFQSAREMADALRAVLAPGQAVQAALVTPPRGTLGTAKDLGITPGAAAPGGEGRESEAVSRVERKIQRRTPLLLLAGAGVVLLLLLLGVLLARQSQPDATPSSETPAIARPAPLPAAVPEAVPQAAPARPTQPAQASAPPQPAAAPTPPPNAPAVPRERTTAPRQKASASHSAPVPPRPAAQAAPKPLVAPAPAPASVPARKPADLGF